MKKLEAIGGTVAALSLATGIYTCGKATGFNTLADAEHAASKALTQNGEMIIAGTPQGDTVQAGGSTYTVHAPGVAQLYEANADRLDDIAHDKRRDGIASVLVGLGMGVGLVGSALRRRGQPLVMYIEVRQHQGEAPPQSPPEAS